MSISHKQNGQFIDETAWNELVDGINNNDAGVSDINTQLNKTTQNGGLSNISARLTSIESKDSSQDGRLTAVELNNTSQDTAISSLGEKIGTGVGTDDIDGSSASGTVGAQLSWLHNNSGGGGGGAVPPGAYKIRAVRTTGGNLPHETSAIYWTEAPEYAIGISIQNNTKIHLEHPGFYIVTASLCLSGTITDGNRFQIWVSPSDDSTIRYGADQYLLPSRYPLVCCTAPVMATSPMDISIFSWNDASATTSLYTANQYCAMTVTYLGPA